MDDLSDLNDLNDDFQSAEVGYLGALTSGMYKAKLVNAEVSRSKNNNLQIKWYLEAETPSGQIGTTIKFSPLVKQSLTFLKSDLNLLGIHLVHINQIYDVLPRMTGTLILIEVQTEPSTGFHKVNFLKKLSPIDFI